MSDELPQGAISLEGDTPEVVGPVAEAAPPEPVAAPAEKPPEEEPVEGVVEGVGGKYVPVQALFTAREELRGLKEKLADIETRYQAAEARGAQYEELRGYVEQARPLIEQLRSQQAQPKPQPQGPLTAEEAVEFAKDMDLYQADGTPDVGRAQRLAARNAAIAKQQVQAALAPFQAKDARQQAVEVARQLAGRKDAKGNTLKAQTIERLFGAMPPELITQPGVSDVLYTIARGIEADERSQQPDEPPPVVPTEGMGGGSQKRTSLSDVESRFARAAGISAKDFSEGAARFKPGQTTILE